MLGALVVGAIALVLVVTWLLQRDDDSADAPFALSGGTSASGDIRPTPSGWRFDLDIEGLDRLDDGDYYQAWLKNDEGTLVPIGSFNEGTDIVLWAGVSPVDYPTLTVTRESADNEQASSGDLVFSGEVVPAD